MKNKKQYIHIISKPSLHLPVCGVEDDEDTIYHRLILIQLFFSLGLVDLASEEKNRLEEKQRAARKKRSKPEEDLKTRWVVTAVLCWGV